jgi:hypothetical protein
VKLGLSPLRMYEKRMFRRIFGLKREKVIEGWRKLHNESFIFCTLHQILVGSSNQRRGMWRAWERWEMFTEFQSGNSKGRARLEDLGVYERVVLK